MKERAIQTVQNYYDSFNRGDMEHFLDLLTQDIAHDINQGGLEIGKEAFHHFMEKMNRHYKEQATQLVILANDEGTSVSAEFFIEGTYLTTDPGLPPANGQKYRIRCGAFFDLKGNKISRITIYYNLTEWLLQVK